MDKKPFEPLTLVPDGLEEVDRYVEGRNDLKTIGENTKNFLSGFYSDFALELLSSADYIANSKGTFERILMSRLKNRDILTHLIQKLC